MENSYDPGAPEAQAPAATPTETLPLLLVELAQTLEPTAEPDSIILARQIALLDRAFERLMNDMVLAKLDPKEYYREIPQGWLVHVLDVQKRCADTARTRAAITYMNGLTPPVKI